MFLCLMWSPCTLQNAVKFKGLWTLQSYFQAIFSLLKLKCYKFGVEYMFLSKMGVESVCCESVRCILKIVAFSHLGRTFAFGEIFGNIFCNLQLLFTGSGHGANHAAINELEDFFINKILHKIPYWYKLVCKN